MDSLPEPAGKSGEPRPEPVDLVTPLDPGADADALMAGMDRDFLTANMRALPLQPRARLTVGRILMAGYQIGARNGRDGMTLDAVAAAANVRLGTVYRYFSTPDDLIRTMVRLWGTRRLARYRARLDSVRFDSIDVIVEHLASGIERMLAGYRFETVVTNRIKQRLLRDYHEIPHGEMWTLAGDIAAKMTRDGFNSGGPDAQARLAMAFASIGARVKMMLLNAPQMHESADLRAQVRATLHEAIEPRTPDAD